MELITEGIMVFLFKVNFHKACDLLLWDYLDDVMVYIGFGIL